jgi:hypothetical protein
MAGETPTDPVFAAFQTVALRRGIPERYALDMIDGFAMDVAGTALRGRSTTAGILLGRGRRRRDDDGPGHGREADALPTLRRAQDLGLAFQLTNIARDIVEDAATAGLRARRLAGRTTPRRPWTSPHDAAGAPGSAGADSRVAGPTGTASADAPARHERPHRRGRTGSRPRRPHRPATTSSASRSGTGRTRRPTPPRHRGHWSRTGRCVVRGGSGAIPSPSRA